MWPLVCEGKQFFHKGEFVKVKSYKDELLMKLTRKAFVSDDDQSRSRSGRGRAEISLQLSQ